MPAQRHVAERIAGRQLQLFQRHDLGIHQQVLFARNLQLLRRVQPTRTQTLLTKAQRAENVRRAFASWEDVRLQGERVILVDDVFTTGATTSACARVLRAAGAGEVCVWTVARGL